MPELDCTNIFSELSADDLCREYADCAYQLNHFKLSMRERLRIIKTMDRDEHPQLARDEVDDAKKVYRNKMEWRLERKKKAIKDALFDRLKEKLNDPKPANNVSS